MNDYTKALHQRFCQEPEGTEEEQEMDRAEQALKATLNREQRKLLLALINAQSLWQERTSLERFAAGLRLDGSTPCCRPLIACQQRRARLSTAARMRRSS